MKNILSAILTIACWMVMASALVLTSCSDGFRELDGIIEGGNGGSDTTTIVTTDSLWFEKNMIDAERINCGLKELGEAQPTLVDEELKLTFHGEMKADFKFTYRWADKEADTTRTVKFNSDNIGTFNGLLSIKVDSDSLNHLFERTYVWEKGAFNVEGTLLPTAFVNKTDVLTYVDGHRVFSHENGTLCGVDVVEATLTFRNIELVEGSKTTYRAEKVITVTFSEGGEREYILSDGLIITSEKDEVVYTIENVVENEKGQISFEVVEKHTIDTDKDIRVPMSFFRETSIAAGKKISREEENKNISLNASVPGDWTYVNKFNQGTISGQVMEQVSTYSYQVASGIFETLVTLTTVRNVTVSYKGQTLEVNLSDPTTNMVSLEEVSSEDEKYFEKFSFEATFYAAFNGVNSNISAVQEIEISVKKKDTVTGITFLSDEFQKRGTNLFSLINYQIEYSVSAPVNASCELNRNLKISDNGKVSTTVDANSLEDGRTNTVKVSDVKSDTTSGERTTTTYTATFGGKAVEVKVSVDSKMSWRGNQLQSCVPSLISAEVKKTSEKMSGIHMVKTYDLITTWSVGGETFEHTQLAEVKYIALDPTFEGYTIEKADVTLAYTRNNRQPGQGIEFLCGVAKEIGGNGYKYFAINVAKYNAAYNGNVAAALAVEGVMKVWDKNVNLSKLTNYCSVIYENIYPYTTFEPADMAAADGTNFADWKQSGNAWDYLSLIDGRVHGFSPVTSTVDRYPNPLVSHLVAADGGVFSYKNIHLLSDK